ncbi:epidermal growth factor-like protein 6 isoform X3 [Hemitrygon akajei]|uniref:epidermal growth factor-like protein 6 isoform X3 n=1 Tax=Hemitrygon akajei TaxID=2704970 RepID=UPI003BF9DE0C
MLHSVWISLLALVELAVSGKTEIYRFRDRRHSGLQPGVCRYGSRLECCYGWRKNYRGHCEAVCEHGCKHGECIGANKCQCYPGFTGKTCNQDFNECGLKPRPCEHRCMNTHGSYKCYCLNGYMLMPDSTCANSRTCAMANCQYGCENVKGEIHCLCPSSGLQLGPDGRTCVDIDECAASTHSCSPHANCHNTQGSFKCKCKQGFRGNGFQCSVKPFLQGNLEGEQGSTDEILNAVPEIPYKETPVILGGSRINGRKSEVIKNAIPQPVSTPPSLDRLQPFDYEDGVYIGRYDEKELDGGYNGNEDKVENYIDSEELTPRGDVFVPRRNEATVFSPVLGKKEIAMQESLNDDFSVDCNFNQGVCEWIQDTEDDFDWKVTDLPNGNGYYMAVPAFVGLKNEVGHLKLLVGDLVPKKDFCLTFKYRLVGERIGSLRVLFNTGNPSFWERTRDKKEDWKVGSITITARNSSETQKNIIFEAKRGKGSTGEIGLDSVILISGPCREDLRE